MGRGAGVGLVPRQLYRCTGRVINGERARARTKEPAREKIGLQLIQAGARTRNAASSAYQVEREKDA